MASARTCYIAILTAGADRILAQQFGKVKVAPIEGRPVWTWSIAPSEGHETDTTFYAAIVKGSFFVLANNEEDFRELANALAKSTAQANLSTGRDLTSLQAHAYWAYRAIQPGEETDPSAVGLGALRVSAVGLELFTELDDRGLFFNVLVPDDRLGSIVAGLPWSDSIRFQRAESGVWRAAISLTSPQTAAAVFQALACFGYVVVL